MEKEQRPSIFKRLIALLIDAIILGSFGYVLGLIFEDFFVSIGKFGVLIGGLIAVLYFGILQSKINNGQSFGKFFLDFKVTDTNGSALSIQKSFIRSLILTFPFVSVSAFMGDNFLFFIGVGLFILILSNLYFVLLNSSRRSLADVLTKSVVTYKNIEEFAVNLPNDYKKSKLIPMIGISLLVLGFSIYSIFSEGTVNDYLTTFYEIEKLERISKVDALTYKTSSFVSTNEESKTSNYIEVVVHLKKEAYLDNNSKEIIDEILKTIKTNIPEAKKVDFISITLSYGFDIGIAKKYRSITEKR